MKKQRITFTGSYDNNSVRNSKPGETIHTVNLRKTNNSLQPCDMQMPITMLADNMRTLRYIHNCNGVQNIITTKAMQVFHEATIENNTTTTVNEVISTLDSIPADINAIGNTLIITSAHEVLYLLHTDGHYKLLGTQPPMPIIRFKSKTVDHTTYTAEKVVYDGRVTAFKEEHYNTITNIVLGYVNKMTDEIHQANAFVMPVVVRYALRMYDGSHIMTSAPVIVYSSNYQYNVENPFRVYLEYLITAQKTTQNRFNIGFYHTAIAYTIDSINLDDWSDIITAIDIFVSREIPIIEDRPIDDGTYSHLNHWEGEGDQFCYIFHYPFYEWKDIENSAMNETLFYPLHEIDVRSASTGEEVVIDNKFTYEELMHQEPLVVDTSSLRSIGAKKSYVYNNRLHLADISRKYYEGYPITLFSTSSNFAASDAVAYIRTDIRLPDGTTNHTISFAKIPHFNYTLSPLLSYPDSNARSMLVVIRHEGYEYSRSFDLLPVANENRASYVNEKILDFNVTLWDKTVIDQNNVNRFPYESSSFYTEQRNTMIVSELNNPFFFPSELSYNISNGIITGIASATTAISQGQYGLFPLYVFTNEGIWCMHVGTGNVCYERTTPISNIQVRTDSPIIATEQAIIFLANKELYIISGSECKVLLPLSEIPTTEFNNYIGLVMENATNAAKDNTPLFNYIAGVTSAIYRQDEKEIVLCNRNFTYCIAYNIITRHLYRWERGFLSIVGNNSVVLAQYQNGLIYNIYEKGNAVTNIALTTKPITICDDTFVRLRQVVWRMQASIFYGTIMVTASHEPDFKNSVIHKAMFNGTIDGHLPINVMAAPYKYYRLILTAEVSPDFVLDGVDIAYDVVENNKLR